MADSTVPAVKAKLVELFAAAAAPVPVSWAAPTEETDYDLVNGNVWLGKVTQDEDWSHSMGAMDRDEVYIVKVWAQVYRRGDDPQITEQQAWAIRAVLSTALRADITLEGVVSLQASLVATEMETLPSSDGWLARAELDVRVQSRI